MGRGIGEREGAEGGSERERETGRQTDRDRETETERKRKKETETERDREREAAAAGGEDVRRFCDGQRFAVRYNAVTVS